MLSTKHPLWLRLAWQLATPAGIIIEFKRDTPNLKWMLNIHKPYKETFRGMTRTPEAEKTARITTNAMLMARLVQRTAGKLSGEGEDNRK
jgi:hypothetical protein